MAITFLFVLLVFVLALVALVFFPSKAECDCKKLPNNLILFAPSFWHLGQDEQGLFRPGAANLRIIAKIDECAAQNKILTVLTQRAISDSISKELPEAVQIRQMHVHCDDVYFNTYHAMLNATTENLSKIEKNQVALIVHPKHLFRSRLALQKALQQSGVHGKPIHLIHLGESPYSNPENWLEPYIWAARELIAVPLQFVQMWLKPLAIPTCRK